MNIVFISIHLHPNVFLQCLNLLCKLFRMYVALRLLGYGCLERCSDTAEPSPFPSQQRRLLTTSAVTSPDVRAGSCGIAVCCLYKSDIRCGGRARSLICFNKMSENSLCNGIMAVAETLGDIN